MKVRLITDPDLPDDPSLFGPPDPPEVWFWCPGCRNRITSEGVGETEVEIGDTGYSTTVDSCLHCGSTDVEEIADEPDPGGAW